MTLVRRLFDDAVINPIRDCEGSDVCDIALACCAPPALPTTSRRR